MLDVLRTSFCLFSFFFGHFINLLSHTSCPTLFVVVVVVVVFVVVVVIVVVFVVVVVVFVVFRLGHHRVRCSSRHAPCHFDFSN